MGDLTFKETTPRGKQYSLTLWFNILKARSVACCCSPGHFVGRRVIRFEQRRKEQLGKGHREGPVICSGSPALFAVSKISATCRHWKSDALRASSSVVSIEADPAFGPALDPNNPPYRRPSTWRSRWWYSYCPQPLWCSGATSVLGRELVSFISLCSPVKETVGVYWDGRYLIGVLILTGILTSDRHRRNHRQFERLF